LILTKRTGGPTGIIYRLKKVLNWYFAMISAHQLLKNMESGGKNCGRARYSITRK